MEKTRGEMKKSRPFSIENGRLLVALTLRGVRMGCDGVAVLVERLSLLFGRLTILWKSTKKQGAEKRIGDVLWDIGALPVRDSGAKKEKGVAHGATPLESGWTS